MKRYRYFTKLLRVICILLSTSLLSSSLGAESTKKRIAIIGGGMAGSAALAIAAKSLPVNQFHIDLFEKNEELGGNAITKYLPNGRGEIVPVELGPQFFDKSDYWKKFPDFLKSLGLYDRGDIQSVWGSLSVERETNPTTAERDLLFLSPGLANSYWLRFLRRPLTTGRNLSAFLYFFQSARTLYLDKDPEHNPNVKRWMETMSLASSEKTVLYAFMASVLGAPISMVKESSAKGVVGFFAYHSLLKAGTYYSFNKTLAEIIQQIPKRVTEMGYNNFKVYLNSQVLSIKSLTNCSGNSARSSRPGHGLGVKIEYRLDGEIYQRDYDYIIFATPPGSTAKMLGECSRYGTVRNLLKQLDDLYFDTQIVIHNDKLNFINTDYDSFYNIILSRGDNGNPQDQGYLLTMNLGVVNKKYGNLVKSWIFSRETYNDLAARGAILAEHWYRHPLMTPEFHRLTRALLNDSTFPTIQFAGAWTAIKESQASAIGSAERALKKLFPQYLK